VLRAQPAHDFSDHLCHRLRQPSAELEGSPLYGNRAADPDRAILFMSGYDDLSGSDDPFAEEMVIEKPFKLVELATAVERALAARGREGARMWDVTPIRQYERDR
jgi:hypothetical protein